MRCTRDSGEVSLVDRDDKFQGDCVEKIGLRFDSCNLRYMVRVFRRFISNANRFLKTSLEYDRVI